MRRRVKRRWSNVSLAEQVENLRKSRRADGSYAGRSSTVSLAEQVGSSGADHDGELKNVCSCHPGMIVTQVTILGIIM